MNKTKSNKIFIANIAMGTLIIIILCFLLVFVIDINFEVFNDMEIIDSIR